MVKLVALYKTPEDAEYFDNLYFNQHLPLAKKMPVLIKCEVSKLKGIGESDQKFYMQAEMYFEDMDKLNSAMASPEGKAAARNLMNFAKDYVVMYFGDVLDK